MMQKKKTILTKAADWAKENKSWLLVLAALLLTGLLALWALDAHRSAQLSALRASYNAAETKRAAAEAKALEYKRRLDENVQALEQLQDNNDQKIKVVTINAYKEARAIPDDRITGSLNDIIAGARRRNADRDRAANNQ